MGRCFIGVFASVSARPVPEGGNNTDVAKTDSVAKVDSIASADPASVVDEVIWVVGDEPILLSDVEMARMQAEMDGVNGKVILTVLYLSSWPCRNCSCIRLR